MRTDVVERVQDAARRVAESAGLEIFDVQFRREASGMVLRVRIDRPGSAATAEDSVSVDDCARISRDLGAILDVEDLVPMAYTLEVSSPGLDRPLLGLGDYRRFVGRRAKVIVRERIDGQGFFKGRLGGVEGESGPEAAVIVIETDDGARRRIPFGAITRANLEVEF